MESSDIKEVVKYTVITSKDTFAHKRHGTEDHELEEFQEKVNSMLADGWELCGGIAIRLGQARGCYFLQAMTNKVLVAEATLQECQ